MAFKVGDNAVYPAHGVGLVKGIEEKNISGKKRTFYILQILDNDMTIMIPTDKVKNVGLRGVIPKKDVKNIYKILKEKKTVISDHQTWNRRYREYMEKIKTGSLYEIAEVLRDLYLLKHEKELSFGERKMLDTAKSLIVKEISIAKKTNEEMVEKDLRDIFGT